jgi:hypothetical protein
MRPEGTGRTEASSLDDLAPGDAPSDLRVIGGIHHGREVRDVVLPGCIWKASIFRTA